jgi:hypothetical protein
MARTALSIISPKGPYSSVVAGDLDFVFEAADDINGNAFPCTGRELTLIRNSHETNAATVTITSAPDPYGRTKDITTYVLDAGEFAAFWVGKTVGWRQSDGMAYLDVAGTGTIEFAVLRISE